MQQLLIDRFRGLFLGVAVLDAHGYGQDDSHRNSILASGQDVPLPRESGKWCEALALGQSEVIAYSRQGSNESQVPAIAIPAPEDDIQLAVLIAQMLPAALFYHENVSRLQDYICGHRLREARPDLQVEVLGIEVAIALLCQEQANPQTLISQLLAQDCLSGTTLHTQLQQVQTLLQTRSSLFRVWSEVNAKRSSETSPLGTALAMACYCWSSTADTFALTVTRPLTLPQFSLLTTLIAGALSGVFNGVHAIPWAWQGAFSAQSGARTSILAQADQLLAAWAGYLSDDIIALPLEQTAISAPGVLRPRG
ncbi:hypothetical protein [Acaryochloris sp. CCMEE 5410]|uniref:hypothetical protein n=1 Tax=Acaryochloris sp. CCMEE 5410 TaxID=310037 RepID=UPI0002484B10|nr:hypothetical protein [Acaryochloris sp. CCMEE 5410]KAI9132712.1 hypothetical protein ON05_004675 [Acaryochloris sp. CCMEE 5410]